MASITKEIEIDDDDFSEYISGLERDEATKLVEEIVEEFDIPIGTTARIKRALASDCDDSFEFITDLIDSLRDRSDFKEFAVSLFERLMDIVTVLKFEEQEGCPPVATNWVLAMLAGHEFPAKGQAYDHMKAALLRVGILKEENAA